MEAVQGNDVTFINPEVRSQIQGLSRSIVSALFSPLSHASPVLSAGLGPQNAAAGTGHKSFRQHMRGALLNNIVAADC
jgi:hypothetical protein